MLFGLTLWGQEAEAQSSLPPNVQPTLPLSDRPAERDFPTIARQEGLQLEPIKPKTRPERKITPSKEQSELPALDALPSLFLYALVGAGVLFVLLIMWRYRPAAGPRPSPSKPQVRITGQASLADQAQSLGALPDAARGLLSLPTAEQRLMRGLVILIAALQKSQDLRLPNSLTAREILALAPSSWSGRALLARQVQAVELVQFANQPLDLDEERALSQAITAFVGPHGGS